jgi:hypothetical protein
MNSFNEELTAFLCLLEQHDWFCDAEIDTLGRFVVYVDRMDIPFIGSTPDRIGGYHVLFHFIASQPISKEPLVAVPLVKNEPIILSKEVLEPEDISYIDLLYLHSELDKLEKICGANILADLFFESHDNKNAVTNLTAKFPEIRKCVDSLYETYGFDIIYENLEL